jgi:hypothetical protein
VPCCLAEFKRCLTEYSGIENYYDYIFSHSLLQILHIFEGVNNNNKRMQVVINNNDNKTVNSLFAKKNFCCKLLFPSTRNKQVQ